MNFKVVFVIRIQLSPRKTITCMDVSPAEAVQKFLRAIAPFRLTPDQMDTATAEFKEIKF